MYPISSSVDANTDMKLTDCPASVPSYWIRSWNSRSVLIHIPDCFRGWYWTRNRWNENLDLASRLQCCGLCIRLLHVPRREYTRHLSSGDETDLKKPTNKTLEEVDALFAQDEAVLNRLIHAEYDENEKPGMQQVENAA